MSTPARGWLDRPGAFAVQCVLLLALNPLTYALHQVSGGLFPDSIAYLALAQRMLESGALYLDGWSHADAGLILPPLYPLLIGSIGRLTGDPMAASYAICSAALLLATVPLLWLGRFLAGPLFGFLAVAVVQAHPLVIEYGAAALTEGPFLLVLVCATCGLVRYCERPRPRTAFALGLVAALLFFCRQIGGVLWPLAAALVALRTLASNRADRLRHAAAQGAWVTAGFAALFLPYALALHAQTGQDPLTQSFRHLRYAVAAPAQAAPAVDATADVYAQRRERRQLLPDGSEMYMWTVAAPAAAASPGARLDSLRRHLAGNLRHLRNGLGSAGVGLLALALLSPLFARAQGPAQWARWLLPATLLAYLGALSLFTGLVARYVHVVVPLAVLQVFAEAAWYWRRLPAAATRPLPSAAVALALAALLVATLPRKSWQLPLSPRIGERHNPLAECARHVGDREPVYAFHPIGAYLVGGTYRVIPNDALDRVVDYGTRTGVRWMLTTVLPLEIGEIQYYSHAPWTEALLTLDRLDPAVSVRCRTPDGIAALYSLGGIEPAPATP